MLGISYGELFLLIGATAALVGPKDLPIIARTAGRLAGRAIGYVQLARGQFENVIQQSQARQVHKELQDAMAQLEAIRYEIRSISLMNPGPMTRKLMDNPLETGSHDDSGNGTFEKGEEVEKRRLETVTKDYNGPQTIESVNLHIKATAYAKLAESEAVKSGSVKGKLDKDKLDDRVGLLTILPLSAESTGMLPIRKEDPMGSDIVLEAVLEAEVAHNAKEFFSQPQNQLPVNE